MMFLASDKALRERRIQLRYQKEVRRLGIKRNQNMTLEQRAYVEYIIQTCFGDHVQKEVNDTFSRYEKLKQCRTVR